MRKLGSGGKYHDAGPVINVSIQISWEMHEDMLILLNEKKYMTRSELIRSAVRELINKEYLVHEVRVELQKDLEVIAVDNKVKVSDGNGGYNIYTIQRRLE